MLPLLTATQIREADNYTIAHESIASIDLMERAAKAFVCWFINHFQDKNESITVYCGTGNNGGDGLAIARLLSEHHYKTISIKVARLSSKTTDDFNINLQRLLSTQTIITDINSGEEFPTENGTIIIDALLGTGLNKPLEGDYKRLVAHLNALNKTIVSVDIPSGFFGEEEINIENEAINAAIVISFQQPKINFLLPEAAPYINYWKAVNIGIDAAFIRSLNSPYQLIEETDIRERLKPRQRFTHKGTYGHALIIAGQPETMGAALLCASACAYTGAGLTTACVPQSGLIALNTLQPEIMAMIRNDKQIFSENDWKKFDAIAIGSGLGQSEQELNILVSLLKTYQKPIVIDADALNLLAVHYGLWKYVPKNSIITPHVKEFDRLFGSHRNWWHRLQTARQMAQEHGVYIILKNDYSITITPDGNLLFNSTGNPSMATGGMGDVLTGILAALLAQGYNSEDACIIGNYIHGKAGDELALPNLATVVLPSALIVQLPQTMAKLMA